MQSNQQLQVDIVEMKHSHNEEISEVIKQKKSVDDENIRLKELVERLRGNLNIFVRVKPDFVIDPLITFEKNSVHLTKKTKKYDNSVRKELTKYMVDGVIPANSTQDDVFALIKNKIELSYDGSSNLTVLAYGHTGSGKTHTMFGSDGDLGVIHRSLNLLNKLGAELYVCALEIYNNNAFDLTFESNNIETNISKLNFTKLNENLTHEFINRVKHCRISRNNLKNDKSSRSQLVLKVKVLNVRNNN